MYRIKIIDKNQPNTYKWYQTAQQAHIMAIVIIRNKDAEIVEVENLAEKKIEKIYKKA